MLHLPKTPLKLYSNLKCAIVVGYFANAIFSLSTSIRIQYTKILLSD